MEAIKKKLSIWPNAKVLITIVDLEEQNRRSYCVEPNEVDSLYFLQNDLALLFDDNVNYIKLKECKNVSEGIESIVYIDEDIRYDFKSPDDEAVEFFDKKYASETKWLRSITYNNTTYYFGNHFTRADVFDYVFYDNHRYLDETEFLFCGAYTWLL